MGQALLQLCRALRLRAIAVARAAPLGDAASWARTQAWLVRLGATHVVKDEGSLRTAFMISATGTTGTATANAGVSASVNVVGFGAAAGGGGGMGVGVGLGAAPRLALDAVGGESSARVVEALTQVGTCLAWCTCYARTRPAHVL